VDVLRGFYCNDYVIIRALGVKINMIQTTGSDAASATWFLPLAEVHNLVYQQITFHVGVDDAIHRYLLSTTLTH